MKTPFQTIGAVSVAVALAGCGTQIGSEDQFQCVQVSSVAVEDLDELPDGFTDTPQDVVDLLVGDFEGTLIDDQERPTSELASMSVARTSADVMLTRYQADPPTDTAGGQTIDMSVHCKPTLTVPLDVTLEADGLPDWSSTVDAVWREDGATVRVEGEAGFDGDVPDPSTFDPDDFDELALQVFLSGGSSGWSATVSWKAHNPSEAAPDGDVPMTTELLAHARVTPK